MKKIYLAGGCFWGVERYFQLADGIIHTRVGYANGTLANPSYGDLCHGLDDASETVEIEYEGISLEDVLDLYLKIVDPYSLNQQGHDIGIQYRTGVYYIDEKEEKIIKDYLDSNIPGKYAIEVCPLKTFYPAEEYHQNYLIKNPNGYCHIDLTKFMKK